MSPFEKFITERNEKADELAKVEAMMDGGAMAQIRASTVHGKREEVHAAQYAASFHCLVEELKDCAGPKPKPKQKSTFVKNKWKRRSIVSSGGRLQANTVA